MTTSRLIRTACTVLAIAASGTSVSAQAQSKYFARERIVGLKTGTETVATPPKAPSCGTLTGNTTSASSGTLVYTGKATTLEEAQSLCESAFSISGLASAACTWVNLTSSGAYQSVRLFKPSGLSSNIYATIYGANCTK